MVYNLPDALGSVRQVAQPSGEVTLAQSYDPFGGQFAQDGSGSSGFGYTGEQEDASSGLVFLRARYYDPGVGRFVSKDPWPGHILRPNTMQGYGYAGNNPILHTDPSGRDYVENVDRYTCDDPNVSGGYSRHVDRATGSFGLWECIVNPANLANLSSSLRVIPVGDPQYPIPIDGQFSYQKTNPPAPTYSYSTPPYVRLLLDDGCPIPNPEPNEPIRISLFPLQIFSMPAEIVVFPPGTNFVVEEQKIDSLNLSLSTAGLLVDGVEMGGLLPPIAGFKIPVLPDTAAVGDVIVTAGASYFAGEFYAFQQPVSSLPPMTVISQDIIVTSADAIAPIAVQGFSGLGGPIGLVAGYVGSERVDVATTLASVAYDSGRLSGNIPTYFAFAVLWEFYPKATVLIQVQEN